MEEADFDCWHHVGIPGCIHENDADLAWRHGEACNCEEANAPLDASESQELQFLAAFVAAAFVADRHVERRVELAVEHERERGTDAARE
jgi:hypothetical protein